MTKNEAQLAYLEQEEININTKEFQLEASPLVALESPTLNINRRYGHLKLEPSDPPQMFPRTPADASRHHHNRLSE